MHNLNSKILGKCDIHIIRRLDKNNLNLRIKKIYIYYFGVPIGYYVD